VSAQYRPLLARWLTVPAGYRSVLPAGLLSESGGKSWTTGPKQARSADVKTTIFSTAVAVAVASWAGFASLVFAQAPGGAMPQYGQLPPGASAQPAPQVGGGMPNVQPRTAGGQFGGNPQPAVGGQLGVGGIAVVDVAYIFKNHLRFKQQMEAMKQRVDNAEKDLKNDQNDMQQMVEKMKIMTPGSPDYKKMEEDITKKQAAFNVKKSLQGKEFMEQEGQIYYKVSLEIDDAVATLATRNGIALVLKFNGDEVHPEDRNDILRSINKPIVYFDHRMDITSNVLQELNRSSGVSLNPNANMAPPQPRR
jgi:Skp family chaperone for outer membrane proteins